MSDVKSGEPIRPDQIGPAQAKYLPAVVFDTFNRLIAGSYSGNAAIVQQEAVVQALMAALGCSRDHVFAHHYLDVEEAYRATGWKVEYDKPAYNESYPATFTFRRARSS